MPTTLKSSALAQLLKTLQHVVAVTGSPPPCYLLLTRVWAALRTWHALAAATADLCSYDVIGLAAECHSIEAMALTTMTSPAVRQAPIPYAAGQDLTLQGYPAAGNMTQLLSPLACCRAGPGALGNTVQARHNNSCWLFTIAAGLDQVLLDYAMQLGPRCLWQVPARTSSVVFRNAAGLDQALLGNAVQTGDKSKDDQHIHDLVKLGAHLLVRPAGIKPRRDAARPLSKPMTACCIPTHAGDGSRHVVSLYLVQLMGAFQMGLITEPGQILRRQQQ